jgi:alpha-beta hydrolase superfamily lysophospholipase
LNGLVDVKAKLVPRGQSLGGALFALVAAAYVEEGVHGAILSAIKPPDRFRFEPVLPRSRLQPKS